MPTAIRETALAAIAARLVAECTTATVERARRSPVDTDVEPLPRLVIAGTDWTADETQEPGGTHYTLGFQVVGYAGGTSDLAAERALSALHASVVAALCGEDFATGLRDVTELDADFNLYDTDTSAKPAGEFSARFSTLITASRGNPYTA
jgi:hypothetical protein